MGLFGCLPRNSSYLSHPQTLTQVMLKFMLNPTNFCPTVANKTDYCWEQWLYETGKGATSYDTVVSPSRRNFSSLNVRVTECHPTDWLHYVLYSCCVAFSFWVQQIHTGLHLSGNIMKTHSNQFGATDLLKTHECSNPHLGMLPKSLWIWLWACSWLFFPHRKSKWLYQSQHTQTLVVKCKRYLMTEKGDTLKPSDWTCISVT